MTSPAMMPAVLRPAKADRVGLMVVTAALRSAVPGMGGVLDVLDSPLLVAPLAYWWLRLMEGKGYLVSH